MTPGTTATPQSRTDARARTLAPSFPATGSDAERRSSRTMLEALRARLESSSLLRSWPGSSNAAAESAARRARDRGPVLWQTIRRLRGVTVTGQGLLFVQEDRGEQRLSVAGTFNGWSPRSTPMRRHPRLRVWYAVAEASPGLHAYRLVDEGGWREDPHNASVRRNPYGGFDNTVEVPAVEAASATAAD